jgi:hypothetical protein|tara:strand:- start:399 stop:569 length:171 start_codon:yes stop_codon:yes gene_type:complete
MSAWKIPDCYLPVDKDLINLFKEFLEMENLEKGFELPIILDKASGEGQVEIILRRA